jgi:membrane protease YdiL (CAAX protease family)
MLEVLKKKYEIQKWPTLSEWGLYLTPIFIAVIILSLDRYALSIRFFELMGSNPYFRKFNVNTLRFFSQIHYTLCSLALFVVLPMIYHFLFPAGIKNPFGLKVKDTLKHYPSYFYLFLIMIPILWLACGLPRMKNFYPLFNPPDFKMWVFYEMIYLTQFFSVEFFFRGFILFRLEKIFKLHAITLMVIPYAFIHIHKPTPEAYGSIIAGLLLGFLAMKGRSIWPGVFLHAGIALFTDWFSLIRSGRFENFF